MVEKADTMLADEPRSRARPKRAGHAHALGAATVNPLGDLNALNHVNQRLTRALRGMFEPLLRTGLRVVADGIEIKRFDDYLAARGPALSSTTLVSMAPLSGQAMILLEGGLIFELVDLYFGGPGRAPEPLPGEFTPTADAMIARLSNGIVERLAAGWRELAEIDFRTGRVESNPALLSHIDGEDRVVLTRFTLLISDTRTATVDILYPAASLKPIASILSSKVQSRRGDADPAWLGALTRVAMNVKLPVRSVLAEPVIPLSKLIALKPGDVIPISFGPEIPLLVSGKTFARGAVGAANGRAAIRLNRLERIEDEEQS
jgi:flagellar motor switch protein FliM